MKHVLVLIGTLIIFCCNCYTQNYDLKFSQVLMLQTSATLGGTVTYTVPADKVWKIEAVMFGGSASNVSCSTSGTVDWNIKQINGVYAGSYILRLLFAVNLTGGSS
ncbi:MAG: hypothetical protein HGB12_12670, partial [Bacteroidetes bacterium]|nr:hypothetical protein [Bacteroidota bacterium]